MNRLAIVMVASTLLIYANPEDKYFKDAELKRIEMEERAEKKLSESEEKYKLSMEVRFAAVDKLWGEHLESTPEKYIEYSQELNSYSSIDFEGGLVQVSAIIDEDSSIEEGKELLAKRIIDTLSKKVEVGGDKSIYLLDDQLPYEESNIKSYAYSLVDNFVAKEKVVQGKNKKILSIEVPLLPDHLEKRAKNYKYIVDLNSQQFGVDTETIYAIIHTESYFNPMAVSPAGAYGLMQLIPSAGAHDAYGYITGNYISPSPDYLFVPKNNVTLGTAYFNILENTHFKRVKSDRNREILAIIAYNWGIGNVQRKVEAVIDVDSYKPEDLYAYIRANKQIPTETRDYIKKILERREMYKGL